MARPVSAQSIALGMALSYDASSRHPLHYEITSCPFCVQDMKYVYGIQASNTRYTQGPLKSMTLQGTHCSLEISVMFRRRKQPTPNPPS